MCSPKATYRHKMVADPYQVISDLEHPTKTKLVLPLYCYFMPSAYTSPSFMLS